MRKILAAALLATTAFTGTASAGCLSDFLTAPDRAPGPFVSRNPDGSITVYPNRVVDEATYAAGRVQTFVSCVS